MQGPGVAPTLAPAAAAQRENYWHFSTCHIAVILIRRTFTTPPCTTLVSSPFRAPDFKSKEKSCKWTFGKFHNRFLKPPNPYDFLIGDPVSRLLTLGFTPPVQNSVLIGGLPFDCESSDFAKVRFQLQERMNIYQCSVNRVSAWRHSPLKWQSGANKNNLRNDNWPNKRVCHKKLFRSKPFYDSLGAFFSL